MQLSPAARNSVMTAHLVSSLGWAGALLVFPAHAFTSWTARDVEVLHAAALAMEIGAWFVILPLALATGLLQTFGTRWGL